MLKTQNKRGQHLPRLMCPVSVLPFCSRRGKENQLMSEVRTVERNMIPHREDVLQGSFRLCNWLPLRRLVSWINHLPPVCWFTFCKSTFKQQLGCLYLEHLNSVLYFHQVFLSVLTFSIDMVFTLSICENDTVCRINIGSCKGLTEPSH